MISIIDKINLETNYLIQDLNFYENFPNLNLYESLVFMKKSFSEKHFSMSR